MLAKRANDPFKMGRKLLMDFFTLEELTTYSSVKPKPGNKNPHPLADQAKMSCLSHT